MRTKTMGIYCITNMNTGKIYIGSSVGIENRFSQHRCFLRRQVHQNAHLQNAWNKYGETAFDFSVIEVIPRVEDLTKTEQLYLDGFEAYNPALGYNLARDAERPALGRVVTAETREKLSESHKGLLQSPESKAKRSASLTGIKRSPTTCAKIGDAHRGLHHTEEAKVKIGAAHKGVVITQETRAKISAGNLGKKRSEETKAKIGLANRGKSPSLEARAKMSAARTGKVQSPETLAKKSASLRAYHQNKKSGGAQ